MEMYVNKSLLLESVLLAVRQLPGERLRIPFYRYPNESIWTHGVHADQCHLNFGFSDRFECKRSKHFKVNRHFTAVLYLNEVEGGNFAFVDIPHNHSYSSLADIPAPSNVYVSRRLEHQRSRSSQSLRQLRENTPSTQPTDITESGHLTGEEYYLTKFGIYTVVVPAVGQLSAFSSGAENIHGVTELLGGEGAVRYSLNVWFTIASSVSNQPTD